MKMVWSPESALEAYIDTVKSCGNFQEPTGAELISAMAAGWNTQLIVETWRYGGATTTSTGLSVATLHTGGRHICVVPDEKTSSEYTKAIEQTGHQAEVIVGQPETAMAAIEGVDFMVVDCCLKDFRRVLKAAKLSNRGAVLICKNANTAAARDFRWRSVLGWKFPIVRTALLPVGKGLNIAYIGDTCENN